VQTIVAAWLNVTYPTDTAFWASEYPTPEYLDLILEIISGGIGALKTAILAMFPGLTAADKKAQDLPTITDAAWKALFKSDPTLLPSFTSPGNTDQRSLAYIAYIRKLFTVGFAAPPSSTPTSSGTVPVFAIEGTTDVLQQFISAYPDGFDFSATLNDSQIDATLSTIFARDTEAQKWVKNAIEAV